MLKLGKHEFADDALLIMAIINRTPDSFYDRGATYEFDAALQRIGQVIAEGAQIVDIGGVKAGPGETVTVEEELERTVDLVSAVRSAFPDIVISVDTWRAEVGEAVCTAGADLLNDAWGGWDPQLAAVAAAHQAGLVCTHAGGLPPRTRPHRIAYDAVIEDIVARTVGEAERAARLGVDRRSILIDPGHDFGKNTQHSLDATRRLPELVATGLPVLVSLSNKDFVGETLGLPVGERLIGTLAATSVSAWLGARVFRAHNITETRQTLDMVASIRGTRQPAGMVRGLA